MRPALRLPCAPVMSRIHANSRFDGKPRRVRNSNDGVRKAYDEEYNKLKKSLIKDSKNASKAVSAVSLLSFDANTILSVCIGAGFSNAYVHTVVQYVDDIERKNWPVHTFMYPAMIVTVSTMLNNSLGLHLNFLEMFAAFFSYKYAVVRILCDEIAKFGRE